MAWERWMQYRMKNSFYIFDRGYNDFRCLHNIKHWVANYVIRGKTTTTSNPWDGSADSLQNQASHLMQPTIWTVSWRWRSILTAAAEISIGTRSTRDSWYSLQIYWLLTWVRNKQWCKLLIIWEIAVKVLNLKYQKNKHKKNSYR